LRGACQDSWSYKKIWRIIHRDGLVDFDCSSFINFAKKLRRRQEEYENERSRKANNSAKAAAVAKAGMAPAREGPGPPE
jgi:hypothetical protein